MTGFRYVSTQAFEAERRRLHPVRQVPLLRPAEAVFGPSWHDGTWNQPKAVVAPPPAAPAAKAPLG